MGIRKWKRLLIVVLTVPMVFSNGAMSQAFAKEATIEGNTTVETVGATSGTCGENVTWTLDDEGTLTISGIGEMYDYGDGIGTGESAPYKKYNYFVNSIVINEGITQIGSYAFYGLSKAESLEMPDSVTTINNSAFCLTDSLYEIEWSNNLQKIGEDAFRQSGIIELDLPDSVTLIEDGAFQYNDNMVYADLPYNISNIPERVFYSNDKLEKISTER